MTSCSAYFARIGQSGTGKNIHIEVREVIVHRVLPRPKSLVLGSVNHNLTFAYCRLCVGGTFGTIDTDFRNPGQSFFSNAVEESVGISL